MGIRLVVWSVLSIGFFCSGCAREQAHPPELIVGVRSPASGAGCSDEELLPRAKRASYGLATYYHDSLEGNLTASGQPYDPDALSAAHRTLPFGTRVRVTRTDVALAPVCVTVNDRGPFAGKRRVIDVSRRAAEQLDMVRAGIVPVRVDVL